MKIIIYATHSFGTFETLKQHPDIVILGWGTKWNEAISGDWGGKPMDDYLSAIDAIASHPYVDKNRLGCVVWETNYPKYAEEIAADAHSMAIVQRVLDLLAAPAV
jgi:hypothetical protein